MAWVVEALRGDAQPAPQPFSAGIAEWDAAVVGRGTRSLAHQQDGRGYPKLKHWFWAQGQMIGAQITGTNATQQRLRRVLGIRLRGQEGSPDPAIFG